MLNCLLVQSCMASARKLQTFMASVIISLFIFSSVFLNSYRSTLRFNSFAPRLHLHHLHLKRAESDCKGPLPRAKTEGDHLHSAQSVCPEFGAPCLNCTAPGVSLVKRRRSRLRTQPTADVAFTQKMQGMGAGGRGGGGEGRESAVFEPHAASRKSGLESGAFLEVFHLLVVLLLQLCLLLFIFLLPK